MNPIGIRYLQFGLQLVLSAKSVMTKPIKKHAVILMMNVPAKKRVARRLLTCVPTQNRNTEPTAPPIATIKYLVISKRLIFSLKDFRQSSSWSPQRMLHVPDQGSPNLFLARLLPAVV